MAVVSKEHQIVDANETMTGNGESQYSSSRKLFHFSLTGLFYVSEMGQWPWSWCETAVSCLGTVITVDQSPGVIWVRGQVQQRRVFLR